MKSVLSLSLLATTLAITVAPMGALGLYAAEPDVPQIAQTWGILGSEEANSQGEASASDSNSVDAQDPDAVPSPSGKVIAERDRYQSVIQQTANMVSNNAAQRLAQRFGLDILNVTWEDTGRYKNSSVGPNISDMTIQVQHRNPRSGQYNLSLMPVIRHPNFSDETADVDLDKFFVLVGNEKGEDLRLCRLGYADVACDTI